MSLFGGHNSTYGMQIYHTLLEDYNETGIDQPLPVLKVVKASEVQHSEYQ